MANPQIYLFAEHDRDSCENRKRAAFRDNGNVETYVRVRDVVWRLFGPLALPDRPSSTVFPIQFLHRKKVSH